MNVSAILLAVRGQIRPNDIVFVFGSAAKGQLGRDSDIDVLIVSETSHQMLVARLEGVIPGREIQVTSYLPQEFASAMRRSDPFLRSVLRQPILRLQGDPKRAL